MNNNQSELSKLKLDYEHADDVPFLRLIGSYKTKRRARQARKSKEPVPWLKRLSSTSRSCS